MYRAASTTAVATGGCAGQQASRGATSGELRGTFDFTVQNFQPTLNVLDKVIPAIQKKHAGIKITYTTLPCGEMDAKAKAAMAAGSGPDGFHTYGNFWRGIDAANMMLPLTPILFTRTELEKLFFANTLDTLDSKKRATYLMPFSAGAGATTMLYHQPMLAAAGVDPAKLTTLDAIVQASKRLVQRDGSGMARAGLLPSAYNALLTRSCCVWGRTPARCWARACMRTRASSRPGSTPRARTSRSRSSPGSNC